MTRRVYLLQGLAQDTRDWDRVAERLPAEVAAERIDVLSLGFRGDEVSLLRAA